MQHNAFSKKGEVLANTLKDGLLGIGDEMVVQSATINWMGLSKPKQIKMLPW